MDNPIYGDEYSKYFNIAFYAYSGFFLLTIFTSCVILIIYTFFHQWQHAFAAGLIVSMIIPIVILLILAYVDPKLKYVTLLLSFIVLFACGVSLTYVWGLRYPGDKCYHPITKERLDNYIYKTDTKTCFQTFSCIGNKDACAVWGRDGTFSKCGTYNATTLICR